MSTTLFDNYDETSEPIECAVKGELPEWLKGTMVRNGPGIYKVGDVQYKHWFDGLAFMQRFHFDDGKLMYSARFLKSDTYLQNTTQKRIVISAFGTRSTPDPDKNIFQRLLSYFEREPVTDNASAHFVKCGDDIYAIGETPFLYRVDPDSLSTVSKEDLGNHVSVQSVTSHNHYDEDGNVYYLGGRYGLSTKYVLFKTTPPSKDNGGHGLERTSVISECPASDSLKPSYVHSFGMTQTHVVFFEAPLVVNLRAALTSRFTGKCIRECFEWLHDKKTIVHVLNRKTGKELPLKIRADGFITFHHANSFEFKDHIVVDYVRYDNVGQLEVFNMENMLSGDALHVDSNRRAYLYRMIIPTELPVECSPGDDLLYGKDLEPGCRFIKQKDGSFYAVDTRLSDIAVDFPQYNYDRFNTKPYRYVYASAIQNDKGSTVGVVKVDTKRRETVVWNKDNAEQICAEPVFVAKPDSENEDDGALICPLVSLEEKDPPLVIVLDAGTMQEMARCTVNTRVPFGFHSVFIPK